ncbi:MAG: hypothetical protein H7274_06855 [Rhodoferax sp.]|nr:hypothetical protein [Rhodoferax sp.]
MTIQQFCIALGAAATLGAVQAHPVAAPAPPATWPAGRTPAQVIDPRAASQAGMPERQALLQAAETALERGMVSTAILGFEQAATMLHAPDTEMGLVRAWMQAGEYRRALAFCAHTAGAHLDSPPASALYAWLLRIGGQGSFASRVLAQTAERAPADPVVAAVRQAFESASPTASPGLLATPHRMAPQATLRGTGQLPPADAQLVSSGVLLGAGDVALVPLSSITGGRRFWVRDGLGRTAEAFVDTAPDALLRAAGFAALHLPSGFGPRPIAWAPKDPFAGSPGFVVAYAASPEAGPAWPWLGQGFFGAFDGDAGMRKLGMILPAALYGGPVLNAQGQLAGIALPGPANQGRMAPVSMFAAFARDHAGAAQPAPDSDGPVARIAPDQAYEQALQIALQVIVLH